ncbi:WEB family protein At4g27595, chloroplastic isoform X2 [Carassius auratus]|uniref:WEB family protein At4g27595, chloroplastic isoform X2 n=1 Tax=Carassius auratus TaxID=7957 RepID=A0A6P6L397_CARAU|nr:WEB family protein At4g27595, chloroplastic-like isoform X2 [Carassius auratus]
MDPPESSVNRIGRTIWTVWGYLSGAVARYLRPEVTDEGNQGVRTRTDDTDLKSAVNKINREVTEDNSNNEGKKTNQIDSADVKCSPSNVRVQVASVQWENTDVAKDDNNDELHVHATKKQTYHCVVWSTGTDTDNERRMVDAQVDKETDSSDEVQAEKAYANNECKESATEHELEETGKIEQKYGDNEDEEERDQNHEVEKCAKNRKDECKTDVMVQLEQDVERGKQINTVDHGETEHADEQLIEEKENNLDQKDQDKTENDEEQELESQVQDLRQSEDPDNADIVVQCDQDVEQEKQINTADHEDTEGIAGFKHADEHLFDETEEQIVDQKDQEKTENDEEQETESQVQELLHLTKYSDEISDVYKNDVEEMMSETRSETEQDKENETVQNLEEIGQLEQNDGDSEDEEECDQNPEDEECAMESEDLDNADVMVQSELHGEDVKQQMQIIMMDHGETGGFGGFKHSDDHHIDEKEKQTVDQMDQEKTENDEEQGTESQVQDLRKSEDPDNTNIVVQCEQDVEQEKQINNECKESATAHELEETGKIEQKYGDNEDEEERDQNHEVEKCARNRKDECKTDVMVQLEQDVERGKQINTVDHGETEHADEQLIEEKENNLDQENDEEQGTESQVQDMLPQLEYLTKYSDELAYNSKNDVEEMMSETRSETEQDKENETVQNLEEIGQLEQNYGDSEDEEECDQNPEDEECAMESEDLDDADVMVQSELHGEDVEQEMQISMMDYAEKEGIGGFKHSDDDHIDEKEKQTVDQMDQEKTENDEEQGTESQVQDVLPQQDYFPDEADGLAKPERLKVMEKYSDEIDEFSKEGVEEVLLKTEHDEDTTEIEQDTIKCEVMESVETLQTVSEELSAKKVPNVELKMTTLVDEFLETVNNPKLSDSKLDTSENTPEMGTGSSVVAMKPEGMISDRIVCEFPGELRKGPETDLGCFEEVQTTLHDLQTLTEEQAEREAVVVCSVEHLETMRTFETKKDIETLIESLGSTESHAHQETDKTTFSHKEHVELRTELTEETIDTKISSEVEEAEPTMKEDQSSVIRNVFLQSHELLEFKGECKSSFGTMDTFNESSVSEIAGTAEIKHLAEEQTDVKPVLTRSLSPAEFLEETVHLKGVSERCTEEQEILEAALEYVEGITNQVLKDMLERQVNVVQETEPLARPSTEEHGDAENKGPAQCVSADAFVLEEEGKSLGETIETKEEMEVETTSNEVLKQAECETTETDGRRDQTQKVIAGETVLRSHEDVMEVSRPGMKRGFDQVSKDLAEVKAKGKFDLYLQAFEESSLDFTIQKARIAVKNPLVRPPKDPRSLLFKVSVEPLVSQRSPRGQKIEVSVPSKGVTGFKLPGLGAGLPVLRKTEFGKKAREGGAAERTLQTQQEPVAVTEDSVKQEQVPAKPKWTPPRHPGMGSPFMMAELKNKLKKPVQE